LKPAARCAPAQLMTIAAAALIAAGFVVAGLWADGPVPGPSAGSLWGVALGMHPEAAKDHDLQYPPSLAPVQAMGANALLLAVPLVQSNLHSHDITPGPDTPSAADLRTVIRRAHRRDMSVALMPFLIVKDGPPEAWRGRLRPHDVSAWWRSYGAQIKAYAALAAEEDIAVFVIGSELSSLSVDPRPWKQLGHEVRNIYQGKLAFVANHDALDLIAPFEAVDIAGVSAYFPLSEDVDASQEELHEGWAGASRRIQTFAQATAKPVLVFEVGYPSVDGGAVRPWDSNNGGPVDLEEQRRAYVAATQALAELELAGAFFWTWFGPGGPYDRHYTPLAKPAQAVLRGFLRARLRGS